MPSPEAFSIQSFLDALKFEKRYSAHTIRAYQDDLIQFRDYLATDFGTLSLAEISSAMVRSWLATLKDAGLTAKSINRKISTLKSFFKHQMVQGVLQQTPMAVVRSPKIAKRLPVYVQEAEIAAAKTESEDFDGYTQQMIVSILYATGIRLSELINLKENDVDEHSATIKVLGKGKKERIVPVSDALLVEMRKYKAEKRRQLEVFDSQYLLVRPGGKKLYPKYVYRAVKAYLSQITTISRKSPHVLRHSFATHLTNNGAELNAVKELLGHASLAATQVYTHNSIAKLKEIHSKAHPKS